MIGECAATNSTSPLHSAIAARNAATRPIAIRPDPLLSAGLTIYPHGPDQPHAARRYSAVLRVDDPRRSPLVLVARGSCTRRVLTYSLCSTPATARTCSTPLHALRYSSGRIRQRVASPATQRADRTGGTDRSCAVSALPR